MDSNLLSAKDLEIATLGKPELDSPLQKLLADGKRHIAAFVEPDERVIFNSRLPDPWFSAGNFSQIPTAELSGPRSKIFFNPSKTRAAIVTCGGLCPGINDVIRAIVMELFYRYGVSEIFGVPHGYRGLVKKFNEPMIRLLPDTVKDIHTMGGTILGTSRGRQDAKETVEYLKENRIDILFTIGGDGTLRGALDIAREAESRHLPISVIGIPKTIDNDIMYIDASFGFETAFSEAAKVIRSAHTEAISSPNGVGLVKLMGRNSGFIASFAALAMTDVNFVLIPEVPFKLDGEKGFLNILRQRLEARKHAVIVVAEGAGQDIVEGGPLGTDASGNPKLKDIGLFLKEKIEKYFNALGAEINLKYIDPSYIIRSIPADPLDSVHCLRLAQGAVHAAMSGRTKMVVGRHSGYFVHLPMEILSRGRQQVNPDGAAWAAVLSATGQPVRFS